MRRARWISFILMATVACGLGYYAGQYIPMAEQWVVYDGLRTTAAIVFGVVGLWLAVIYPDVLHIFAQWQQGPEPSTPRVTRLFPPLITSALIVVIIAIAALLRPALPHLLPASIPISAIRGASFGLLAFLTLLQVEAVWRATTPLLGIGDRLRAASDRAQIRSRFTQPREVAVRDEEDEMSENVSVRSHR